MGRGDKGRLGSADSPNREAESGVVQRPLSLPVRKLKPGPGLTPEVVFADQRRRLRAAAIELLANGGYDHVTVRAVSRQAGVSTRTFYRQFANVADCVGFAAESSMLDALEQMKDASSGARTRQDAVNAAIASLMQYFASNLEAASVALSGAFDAGPSVLVRLQAAIRGFEKLFVDLLGASSEPPIVPRPLVSGIVAGVLRIARATSVAGRGPELPGLAPGLSEWALTLAAPGDEELYRPFARIRSGAGTRREASPFADGQRLGGGAPGGDDRDRILRATVRLAAADGFASLTIPRIRRVAGVSRKSFNGHFASARECFLASIEWMVGLAAARAWAWASSDPDRDLRTHKVILALCTQAARNPGLARLVFVGVLDAGRDGLLCRDRMLALGVASMRKDLLLVSPTDDLALEASIAAAWQVAGAEVTSGQPARLPGLSALLAHAILAPARSFETSEGVAPDR
jgi:AcrR family transcriptional regulator